MNEPVTPDPPSWYMAKFERLARLIYPMVEDRTGAVVLHFAQGHPNGAEIPGVPTVIRLDKRPERA